MRLSRDVLIFGALLGATTAVALLAYRAGQANPLEVFAFISGALCVWLTVKQNVWNWPIGIANAALFAVVFLQARLFSDAGLNVLYVVLGVLGWYWWLRGGEHKTALDPSHVGRTEAIAVAVAGAACTCLLFALNRHAGGSAPFWDALTTALCLCAQYLLTRKYIENWFCWLAADVTYVPLYAWKGLYLSSLLYGVFIVMCLLGLKAWRTAVLKAPTERRGFEVVLPSTVAAEATATS